MAASEYGLSIVLDFQDNASAGMQSASNTFSNLSGSADKLSMGIGSTANSLLDMNTSVVGMSVLGSQLQNMGQGLLGVMTNVGSKVINTSSSFENFGLTLKALYKDGDKVNKVTNDLFAYANKSPFEVEDLQSMVVTLKSQGLEAFDQMQGKTTGLRQETMAWIGDLQAFRPGTTALKWKQAIQNFLSGDDTVSAKMLRNILDVGDLSNYLGHDLHKTVEGRMQDLIEIVEKTGMAGMQNTLSNTWSIVLSNMEDAWTTFTYRIGFGNKENNMYKSATNAVRNLLEVEQSIFSNDSIINATSDALYGLVNPVEKFTQALKSVSPALTSWLSKHPQIIKFGTDLTVIGGISLQAAGGLLRLSGAVINYMLNVQRLGGFTGIFNMLGNSIQALTFRSLGWVSAIGLLGIVFTRNYGNISGYLSSLTKQAKGLFSEIFKGIEQGKTLTQSLIDAGLQPLVTGIDSLKTALQTIGSSVYNGIAEALGVFGFHSEKIDATNFSLKTMLNTLGEGMTKKFGGEEFQKKWGSTIDTFGRIAGAFIVAYGGSTLLAGGLKMLSGAGATLLTNFKVLATTLMSPTGLFGLGLGALVAGYKSDFLGLQETVTPMVANIREQMDTLKKSFGAKNKDGKNTILETLSNKIREFNSKSKEMSFSQSITQFMSDGTSQVSDSIQHGISLGQALGQGISTGLLLFGGPIQKAIGAIMFGYSFNIGNLQEGVQKFVPQLINAKDLLLEMSTGYGQKSVDLANRFGLTPFAEGIVNAKRNIKDMWSSFVQGYLKTNPIVADTVRKIFGEDLDLSVNGILNKFGELSNKVTEWLKNTTIFGESLSSVLGNIAAKASVAVPILAGLSMASKLIGFDVSPVTGGLDLIRSGFSLVLDGARTTVNGIRSAFQSARQFAGNFFTFARDTIRDFWANARGNNGNGGSFFGDAFTSLRQNFSTMGNAISMSLDEMVTNFRGSAENISAIWGTAMQDIWTNFQGFLAGNVGTILRTVAQVSAGIQMFKWQALYNGVTTSIKMLGSAVMGASKMVIGLHGVALGLAAVTMGALTFGTITTAQWEDLNNQLKNQETLVGKVRVAYDWFTDNLSDVTSRVGDFIKNIDVQSLTTKAMSLIGSVGEAFASVIGGTLGTNGMADVAGNLIDQFVAGLANGTSGISNSIYKIFLSVTSAIKTYAPSIGQNLAKLIADGISFAGANAGTFFDTAFTIIDSFINGLVANSDRIAQGISQLFSGLSNAIMTHVPQIVNNVKGLLENIISAIDKNSLNKALGTVLFSLIDGLKSFANTVFPQLKQIFSYAMKALAAEVAEGLAKIVAPVALIADALLLIPGVREVVAPIAAASTAAMVALGVWAGAAKIDAAMAKNELVGSTAAMNDALASNNAALDANKQKRLEWATAEQAENFHYTTQGQLKAAQENNNSLVTNEGYDGYVQYLDDLSQAQNKHTLVYRVAWDNDSQSYKTVLQQLQVVKEEDGKQHVVNVDYQVNGQVVENAMNQLEQWGNTYHLVTYSVSDDGTAQQALTDTQLTVEEAQKYCAENGLKIEVDVVKKDEKGVHEIVQEEQEEANKSTLTVTPTYGADSVTDQERIDKMTDQYRELGEAISTAQTNMKNLDTDFYNKSVFSQMTPIKDETVNSWNIFAAALKTVDTATLDSDKLQTFAEAINSLPDNVNKEITINSTMNGIDNTSAYNLNTFTGAISKINWDTKSVSLSASGNVVSDAATMAENMKSFTEAYDELPSESLEISVTFDFQQSLTSLDSSLSSFSGTTANVTVSVFGVDASKTRVQNLIDKIKEVKNKTAFVTAFTFGKRNVEKLAEAIDNVKSKTVTITANYSTSGSIPTVSTEKTFSGGTDLYKKTVNGSFATGTDYFEGGTALINEKGGEIVDLPRGTRIIPHDESVTEGFKTGYRLASSRLSNGIEALASATTSKVSHSSTPNKIETMDNSVHFGEGSIVVKVDNAKGETDYAKAAQTIMKYIEKEQRRSSMARRA